MINQIAQITTSLLMLWNATVAPITLYNQAPEIISVYTNKKNFEIGEPIDLGYFYMNEKGEKIEEKWTYRREDDAPNNVLYTKPEALFYKGKYIVTLQLRDEKGNVGHIQKYHIQVKDKGNQTEYEMKFGKTPIGTTIDNFEGINYRNYLGLEGVTEYTGEGTLIMSNSPENVKKTGILYQEDVTGNGRLLVHHIHQMDKDKRLVILAQNNNSNRIELALKNKTFKGPSKDVLYIGQQVLYDYLDNQKGMHINLDPHSTYVIYDSGTSKWKYDEVISGMIDFESKDKIRYIVAAVEPDTPIEKIEKMECVPRDIHPRGTYNITGRHYQVILNQKGQSTKLVLGENDEEWAVGQDGLTGKKCINKGNFGITYHIYITAKENTAVILNPRGDMFRGAVKWEGEGTYMAPKYGYFPDLNRAAYLGIVKAGETKELIYMLPCGSAAPVILGFIPESNWSN